MIHTYIHTLSFFRDMVSSVRIIITTFDEFNVELKLEVSHEVLRICIHVCMYVCMYIDIFYLLRCMYVLVFRMR